MDGNALCLLSGQSGGLTQLLFSQDGSLLLSAGRKDNEILCWDLRHLGQTLWVARRPHTTNQRLYMDLSSDERYLLSGFYLNYTISFINCIYAATKFSPISLFLKFMFSSLFCFSSL